MPFSLVKMNDDNRILLYAILATLFFIFIDTIFDPAFGKADFMTLLVFGHSWHEFFMRFMIVLLFIGFGVVASRFLKRHRKVENNLAEKTVYLDNILSRSAEFAIITVDKDFRITYFNPAAEKFFNYWAGEVIGKNLRDLHMAESIPASRFANGMEQVMKKGEYSFTALRSTRDGLKYIESTVTGIFDPDKELVGYANFSRDVTASKIAAEEKERLIKELKDALGDVEILSGLLPICSYCKKVRDDKGYWTRLETYISTRSHAEFTHGICPECETKLKNS